MLRRIGDAPVIYNEEEAPVSYTHLYNEIEKSVAAGFMKSNPYKDRGFVPGEYTEENYDKIDLASSAMQKTCGVIPFCSHRESRIFSKRR